MKLLIIGAGPGGYETAISASRMGFETILIESGNLGGTCLNAGCIPTKAYCRSAEIAEEVRISRSFGIGSGGCTVDFPAVKARKDGIVESLRAGIGTLLEQSGVQVVHGRAEFRDARTVSADGVEYTADYIIIATGSVPVMPDIPGITLPQVLDSTSLLEMDTLPGRLCIIGGGVIGLEFSSVFRSFGCDVTVVEFCREILPRFDQDIARRLRQGLARRGIKFCLQSAVTSVGSVQEEGRDCVKVTWSRKGTESSCIADKVLVAVGRRPDCRALNPEAAGVRVEKGAVPVDEDMRTAVPWIFAIGDVNGRQLLAHAAVFQGKRALAAIARDFGVAAPGNGTADLAVMPSAVFTMPEAAAVGLTEEECRERNIGYKVCRSFFRANGKAVCLGETEGLCKLLVSTVDGSILGCHITGPGAAGMVQEAASLMSARAGLDILRNTVHIHPTLGEVLLDAAEEA